jgi:ketosteroid isomerase-like protein
LDILEVEPEINDEVLEMKEVDIEAEKKILTRIGDKMTVDHTSNIDDIMKYVADEAVLIPPNSSIIDGAKAIREAVKEMIKTKVISMSGGDYRLEVSKSGDLAYDIGQFRIVNQGPEGPIKEEGYFVTLYKKIDGQWKFMGQIWNNVNPK